MRRLDVREDVAHPARRPAAECRETGQAPAQLAAQTCLSKSECAVVRRARKARSEGSAALGVRADGGQLGSVQPFQGLHQIGSDPPPVGDRRDLVETVGQRSGPRALYVALGQLADERVGPARLAAAVVDGLVARDHGGAGAGQLERQRQLCRRRAEQGEHDLGAHVVGVLCLDSRTAQLRVHGAANTRTRDRVAHVSRQHACRGAQADAARGALQLLHAARLHLLLTN